MQAEEPAPPEGAAGQPEGERRSAQARQLWRQFQRERHQQRARGDRLAAAVFLSVLIAMRFKVGELPTAAQEGHGLATLLLTVAVMMASADLVEDGLAGVRSALVLLFKLSVSTCPLFRHFCTSFFQEYPKASGPQLVATALVRVAVADHTALLLLLGLSMPQGIVGDTVAQLLFFATLSSQTGALCASPFVRVSLKSVPLTSFMATRRTCITFIASMQLWIGVVLPVLVSVRRESSAAVQFARRSGIPESDPRLRTYTWLLRATSPGDAQNARLAAVLVGVFGVWVVAAWAYLGKVYST